MEAALEGEGGEAAAVIKKKKVLQFVHVEVEKNRKNKKTVRGSLKRTPRSDGYWDR
jgi:hypothetical protein